MTVAFALIAAGLYGLSDFVGGVASRRTSVWPVGLLACLGAALGAVVIAAVSEGSPTTADLLLGAAAGIGSGAGTAFLYRGLAAGRMGVVAPVSAVGSVLIPLLAAVVGGERPALIGWIGFAVALPGIWYVSRETPAAGSTSSGLIDGIAAGIGFGLLFAVLGQVSENAGFWPLVTTQSMSIVALVAVALLVGGDPLPRQRGDLWGLIPGILATSAVFFFLLASRAGLLSIAAVISSLYPAVTVVLAIAVLRERVHRIQGLGLALCATAVVLISLA